MGIALVGTIAIDLRNTLGLGQQRACLGQQSFKPWKTGKLGKQYQASLVPLVLLGKVS